MNTTVSYAKYLQIGTLMLVLCILVMIIYGNYFHGAAFYDKNYEVDLCVISSMRHTTVEYICYGMGNSVTVTANMPCVIITVNTTKHTNLKMYRNTHERKLLEDLGIQDCSYAPSACANDPYFLGKLLNNSIFSLFPPMNFQFECFVAKPGVYGKNNHYRDVILFIPNKTIYQGSLIIIAFGIILSGCIIFQGVLSFLRSNSGYFDTINHIFIYENRLLRKFIPNDFSNYVKRVLDETHISWEDLLGKEMAYEIKTDILPDKPSANKPTNEKDESQEPQELKDQYGPKGNLKGSSGYLNSDNNISRSSQTTLRNYPYYKRRPSKVRIGESEYFTGRMEYKPPVHSQPVSRRNSVVSATSLTNRSTKSETSSVHVWIGPGVVGQALYDKESSFLDTDVLSIPGVIAEEHEEHRES